VLCVIRAEPLGWSSAEVIALLAGGVALLLALPGIVLFGMGIIAVGTPAQIAAVTDVRHDVAGAASGVVNAGYQVGGALGVAVITTLATSHVTALATGGASQVSVVVGGFRRGLLVTAVFAAANLLISVEAPGIRPTGDQLAEAAAVA
jgi:hypothetical protein